MRLTIEGNLKAWEYLKGLKTVFVEAERREKNVHLLDPDHPETNAFHVTDESRFAVGAVAIRADVAVRLGNRGKSAGARILIATNRADRWFFVFSFEKNERANISDSELEALRELAVDLLACSEHQLNEAVTEGTLQEICHDNP